MDSKTVYIVHAVDTEGPLAENNLSLAHQKRKNSPKDYKSPNFNLMSPEQIDKYSLHHRHDTLGSWEEIISMLKLATSTKQRNKMLDSFGCGWIYNWFCMDHIGYIDNPRRRSMGIHQIFDFYSQMCKNQKKNGDKVHWHFHPMSTYKEAHRCSNSYINSPELYEIIGRRLIDRKWFPSVHRAGFQDERPDSNWFLEQWIPFDISNTSVKNIDSKLNPDVASGRFSDWRWAPSDWRIYHPSHDCYQLEGNSRRKIARCLNVLNRFANINEEEMNNAFERAQSGNPTLVGIASHDWRNLNSEVEYVRLLLKKASDSYPDVKYKFSEAIEAFNLVNLGEKNLPIKLDCKIQFNEKQNPSRIDVKAKQGKIFGPQPFIAIKNRSRKIIHDNFNYGKDLNHFAYEFDSESILPDDVHSIGIATNDFDGNQSIHVIDIDETANNRSKTISF